MESVPGRVCLGEVGMITLTIPGKPYAWKRAARNGRVTYTPKEQSDYYATLQAIGLRHFAEPISGPVRLTVIATFAMPASWSKKKRAALLHRHHTQKPDMDNIEKAIGDGLNRIAWVDDAQIAERGKGTGKFWGLEDKTIVHVEEIGGSE